MSFQLANAVESRYPLVMQNKMRGEPRYWRLAFRAEPAPGAIVIEGTRPTRDELITVLAMLPAVPVWMVPVFEVIVDVMWGPAT